MWKIGDIELKNKIVLAPMAGISNPAFIKICEEMGCAYAITELISAEAIVRNNKKTFAMLNGLDKINIPIAVQIFGSNPSSLSNAAKILVTNYNVKIIDINMGCPVPKVAVHANAGASLMKNPSLVYDIVKSVSSSVNAIVTVKIRSGWDKDNINAALIAKICEDAGCKCITIHARTRSQGYSGLSDWSVIKSVKENVNIPVIGNGDIKSGADAKRMIDETGCDAVMIGRGLLGNPFLIKECLCYLNGKEYTPPSYSEKIDVCLLHMNYLSKIKTEKEVVLEMRGNASWYIKGFPNSSNIKNNIFKCNKISDIVNVLEEYKKELEEFYE